MRFTVRDAGFPVRLALFISAIFLLAGLLRGHWLFYPLIVMGVTLTLWLGFFIKGCIESVRAATNALREPHSHLPSSGCWLTQPLTEAVAERIAQAEASSLRHKEWLRQLTPLSEEISRQLEHLKKLSQRVEALSEQLSKTRKEQDAKIAQSKEIAKNLTSSIADNFGVVGNTLKAVAAAGTEAEQGGKYAENAKATLANINENVESTLRNTKSLQEKSRRIGKIVAMITEISEQTKLLSLNAAIEASRAGEAGKGFGVVAEEIRKLSDQSARSVKEVSELAEEISASTLNVAQGMEQSARDVQLGSKVIGDALEKLQSISQITSKTTAFVEDVYSMFEQQLAGARAISGSVGQIEGMSLESIDSLTKVSEWLRENSSTLDALAGRVRGLVRAIKGVEAEGNAQSNQPKG